MKLLIDKGVDVSAQDANGHTALHVASLLNHGHLVGPLLSAGIDVSRVDRKGKIAEDLAGDKGSDSVLRQFSIMKL